MALRYGLLTDWGPTEDSPRGASLGSGRTLGLLPNSAQERRDQEQRPSYHREHRDRKHYRDPGGSHDQRGQLRLRVSHRSSTFASLRCLNFLCRHDSSLFFSLLFFSLLRQVASDQPVEVGHG
jgi:hypothetical protein